MRITHGTVLLATLAFGSRAWSQEAKPKEHGWDYGKQHGPGHWGEIKPEFAICKAGHLQSPNDIRKTQKADLPALGFDYQPSRLRIVDNGHTIMVSYAAGSSLRVGDRRYELKQFHFHRPSEERIRGKRYAMGVHIVHQDAAGELAVVAVLLDRGAEQPLVRKLWDALPSQKEKEEESSVEINAADLLPKDRGYFTFAGSLTTPPCSENVTWFVLKQPVPISTDEVAVFSKLYRDNTRPVQPLYGRVVKETR